MMCIAGRKLMIGGVEIPHDKVLEGHSDADVALHALTDALLGAIGDGDIGMHFSPKDARWKGADSATFLRHAGELIARQGGAISHVDVTIICEAPKIGAHRDKIRTRIGEILNLPATRVSVKATTTEGLGFTGRGEGIAAEAVATVRLPFVRAGSEAAESLRKWGT
jgi:2-C-methyl-D-erythritol 4-phosphate cytidylyltransferase/2-C-methyl-D-erythritol 2,4-cyclodiphosphate synthase